MAEERLFVAGAEVLAFSSTALLLLTTVVHDVHIEAREGKPAIVGRCLDSLRSSNILAVICCALLRLDPTCPPRARSGEAVVGHVMIALTSVLEAVGMLVEHSRHLTSE